MNPRQRRGILLILVTILGAIVTFLAVLNYVQSVSSQVGPKTTVLELSKDVAELQEITAADVTATEVPERWAPKDAVHDLSEFQGKVTASLLPQGGRHPDQHASGPAAADGGLPRGDDHGRRRDRRGRQDHIRLARRRRLHPAGSQRQAADGSGHHPERAHHRRRGATKVEDESASGDFTKVGAVPVTFALTPDESLKLAYAESFSKKVRLLLRRDGDDSSVNSPEYSTTTDSPDATGGNQ